MLKHLILTCTFLSIFNAKSQLDSRDIELSSNIQYFRNATISFGIDTISRFVDFSGKVVSKKIFSTVGTGVVFYFNYKDYYIPCVVTAKHVLRDTMNGWAPRNLRIRFVQDEGLPVDSFFGEAYSLYGNLNLPIWWEHPDSTIDLAAFLLDPNKESSRKLKGVVAYNYLPDDNEYFAGKEVFVLGYPSAVGLDLLNRAVLRRGIISWVPTDLQKSGSKILIDCNIFPGNSGGPVFSTTRNQGIILSDTSLEKPKFYGIVSQRRFSHNNLISSGGVLLDSKGMPINSLESIGIGVIITAKRVRELLLIAQSSFKEWIDKHEKEQKK